MRKTDSINYPLLGHPVPTPTPSPQRRTVLGAAPDDHQPFRGVATWQRGNPFTESPYARRQEKLFHHYESRIIYIMNYRNSLPGCHPHKFTPLVLRL